VSANISVDVANVRFSPSLDQKVLFQMNQGDPVTVLGRTADGSWLLVDTGMMAATSKHMIGWIKANQLSIGKNDINSLPAATPMPTATSLPGRAGDVKPGTNGRLYTYTDEYGFVLTYNVSCGSPLPAGATCTCDCVTVPLPSATPTNMPPCNPHGCSCDDFNHYWYPN
jgi:hypothetical protein